MALPEPGKRWAPSGGYRFLLVVAAAALALAATGAGGGLGATPHRTVGGGTFVMTNLSDPDPIDPALVSHTMSRTFVRNVYETLVYYKLGTTQLLPVLATSWRVSADGLRYTFQLRKNVKFHNGAPFTAQDVKATIDRDL